MMDNMWRAAATGMIGLTLLACSQQPTASPCGTQCPAGTVCLKGACTQLCAQDADCHGMCCSEAQVCVAECANSASEISAGQYTLAALNQAGICSAETSLLRGQQGAVGAPGAVYTIASQSHSGLMLQDYALSVAPQFILDTIEAAKPSGVERAITLTPVDFMPTQLKTDTAVWDVTAERMFSTKTPSSSVSTTANALIDLPQGAALAGIVCLGSSYGINLDASDVGKVSVELWSLKRHPDHENRDVTTLCPGSSKDFPFAQEPKHIDIELDTECQAPAYSDAGFANFQMYFIRVIGNLGATGASYGHNTSNSLRHCRVSYTLP